MDYRQLVDIDLVKLLANNDEDAFCELYSRYRKKLYSFCLTFIKTPEAAEDILQEVFVTIWTGRKCLNPSMSFSSFIYTITRNRLLNYLRQASQDVRIRAQLQKANVLQEYTEQTLQEEEYDQLLHQAVDQLPPLQQKIFHLSRFERKSHKEIAQILSISPYTVQENISAALKYIKSYMTRYTGMHFGLWMFYLIAGINVF